jgi:coenzyme F420-reducing hydrogenase beta subunit
VERFPAVIELQKMASIKDFGSVDSVFFAYSGDDTIRFQASSGGFIKSFLVYLLESRTVDFAVITRTGGPGSPLVPETIVTNSKDDILSTRTNSVYAVNNPLVVLKELASDRKYAFVGLPCQVRNLRALQKKGKYSNIAVTIGLFCNHTPNIGFTRGILQKLNVKEDDVKQIEYRGNGWPGGFTAHLKNGDKKFIALQDYWSNDLDNGPEACKHCSETAEEADIYVGDPWNLGLEKTDLKGTSLVICRARRATRLVREAAEAGYIEVCEGSREQLVQSQGYHIEAKIRRESGKSGHVKPGIPSGVARRLANLLAHPRLAYRVAMDISRTRLGPGRLPSKLKVAMAGCKQAVNLLREPDHFSLTYVACRMPIINGLLKRIFANRVLIWHWREERKLVNFGDYITEVLVKEFGYKTVNYCNARSLNMLSNYKFCLLIIGSELHKRMVDSLKVPELYVWGQGKGHGEFFDIRSEPYASKVKIFAVRGPHTVEQLNLREDTPVGDPAFLMPLFFKVRKDASQHKVSYIPHWTNRANWEGKKGKLGAERFVDIMCSRREFRSKLNEIVSSKFVLTNSFHTAVVCHAYGTPWALCLADEDELNFPDKWTDLFEFLGIEDNATAARNYAEGLQWWTKIGSKAKRPDLLPLLDSFPLPVKNKRTLAIINQVKSNRPIVRD